jgi:hypothetical protein
MQHMQSKQIKLGPAKHQPFLELQAVDLGLDLPVIPLRREGGTHCCIVATDALGKAFELGNAAVFSLSRRMCGYNASEAMLREDWRR